jgi:hypothetical protein
MNQSWESGVAHISECTPKLQSHESLESQEAQGRSPRSCGNVGAHREEPQPSDGKKARPLIRVG